MCLKLLLYKNKIKNGAFTDYNILCPYFIQLIWCTTKNIFLSINVGYYTKIVPLSPSFEELFQYYYGMNPSH
jgi:hypothetical protein